MTNSEVFDHVREAYLGANDLAKSPQQRLNYALEILGRLAERLKADRDRDVDPVPVGDDPDGREAAWVKTELAAKEARARLEKLDEAARLAGTARCAGHNGTTDPNPVRWNPYNKVVMDHRNGTIDLDRTNYERLIRGLSVPWSLELVSKEVHEKPAF